MIEKKIRGFVYHLADYQENDRIVTVLTEEGSVSFKARGIKKPTSKNAAACNFFTISDFVLTSRSEQHHAVLKSATIVQLFHQPYENLLTSAAYLLLCHLIHSLSSTLNLYDFLLACFQLLEEKKYPVQVLNYFFKNLLDSLGYQPYVDGCVHCHQKSQLLSFSLLDGGFICQHCLDPMKHKRYPVRFLKSIHTFYKEKQYTPLEEEDAISLLYLYTGFITEEVGLTLKGLDFLKQCL